MADPLYNPFLGPPPPADPARAAALEALQHPALSLRAPPLSPFHGQGPLLSLADQAQLEQAPKLPRQPGTTVTTEAYPVRGFPVFGAADHMFNLYDDGREQYIQRAGGNPWPFLHETVTLARQSPDFGMGQRTLFKTFLPNVSARQAIQPAQADADRVNRSGDPYLGVTSNSNSVIGDFMARQFGHRVGDARTPGYRYDLPDQSPIPDLSPVIREPYWY